MGFSQINVRPYGQCLGRRFCISQSAVKNLTRWLIWLPSSEMAIRLTFVWGLFYSNSRGQVGLLVAAWDGSQWVQMISPGVPTSRKMA